jgi:hypothetical protein
MITWHLLSRLYSDTFRAATAFLDNRKTHGLNHAEKAWDHISQLLDVEGERKYG